MSQSQKLLGFYLIKSYTNKLIEFQRVILASSFDPNSLHMNFVLANENKVYLLYVYKYGAVIASKCKTICYGLSDKLCLSRPIISFYEMFF